MDVDGHGTGCTLASAIAANLCLGRTPVDACAAAIGYVHDALGRGYAPGQGDVLVLDHFGARRPCWARLWRARRRRMASRRPISRPPPPTVTPPPCPPPVRSHPDPPPFSLRRNACT